MFPFTDSLSSSLVFPSLSLPDISYPVACLPRFQAGFLLLSRHLFMALCLTDLLCFLCCPFASLIFLNLPLLFGYFDLFWAYLCGFLLLNLFLRSDSLASGMCFLLHSTSLSYYMPLVTTTFLSIWTLLWSTCFPVIQLAPRTSIALLFWLSVDSPRNASGHLLQPRHFVKHLETA